MIDKKLVATSACHMYCSPTNSTVRFLTTVSPEDPSDDSACRMKGKYGKIDVEKIGKNKQK
jgi:hypothetical protein